MPARILCLIVLLFASTLAGADEGAPGGARSQGPGNKSGSSGKEGPDGLMLGYAFVSNLNGMNLEWAFEHNTVYLVPGYYFDSGGARTDTARWVTGYRHLLEDTPTDESGFFTGALAGHLDGKRQTERLGLGGELGHQWVKDYTRWTFSASLVALEDRPAHDQGVEPEVFFAFSVSLR